MTRRLLLGWEGRPRLLLEWHPTPAGVPRVPSDEGGGADVPVERGGVGARGAGPSSPAPPITRRKTVGRDPDKWHLPEFPPLDPNEPEPPRRTRAARPTASAPVPGGAAPVAPKPVKRRPPRGPTVAPAGGRMDLIIVPRSPSFRASEQGVKAVVRYLHASQILTPVSERRGDEGLFVRLRPGAFAHLAFTGGEAPDGASSLLEARLFSGSVSTPLPWGSPERRACLWLTLVGARFERVDERLLARLHQILYLRPEVVGAPHDPARLSADVRSASEVPIQSVAVEEF